MNSLNQHVFLITGRDVSDYFTHSSKVSTIPLEHPRTDNILLRIYHYSSTQFRYAMRMFQISPDVDKWVFFIGGETLLFPMIAAKITGKPTFLVFPGSAVKTCVAHSDPLTVVSKRLSKMCCRLCDHIVVYSPNNIQDYNLDSFKDKIRLANEHIVDCQFQPIFAFEKRKNIIGYLGRFSPEKGILQFVESLPSVLRDMPESEVMLIGDGPMRNDLQKVLRNEGIEDRVKFEGWASRESLPGLLNQLRLLVIPSFTEGLPNAMLEAMACEVAILASAVGSIPDIIIDEENGFLLETNHPEIMAERMIELFNRTEMMCSVAKNGRKSIINRFTLDAQTEKWSRILD